MSAWLKLSPREQGAVLLCAACMLLWLLWMWVVSPLQGAIEAREQTVVNTGHTLLRVQALAKDLQALRAQSGDKPLEAASLAQVVDQSVRRSRLQMAGFQPGRNNDATVRFERVAFSNLLDWMATIESSGHVRVSEMSVQSSGDAGMVSATVKLLGTP